MMTLVLQSSQSTCSSVSSPQKLVHQLFFFSEAFGLLLLLSWSCLSLLMLLLSPWWWLILLCAFAEGRDSCQQWIQVSTCCHFFYHLSRSHWTHLQQHCFDRLSLALDRSQFAFFAHFYLIAKYGGVGLGLDLAPCHCCLFESLGLSSFCPE